MWRYAEQNKDYQLQKFIQATRNILNQQLIRLLSLTFHNLLVNEDADENLKRCIVHCLSLYTCDCMHSSIPSTTNIPIRIRICGGN